MLEIYRVVDEDYFDRHPRGVDPEGGMECRDTAG